MFAYCGNNPVSSSDASRNESISIRNSTNELLQAMLFGAAVAATILEVTNTKDDVKEKIKADTNDGGKEHYTVYFLCAEDDPSHTIVYVGRVKSKNFDARMRYHAGRGRTLVSAITNLDYLSCRAIEQGGMIYYHTINRDLAIHNQIRGISPTNGNRYDYLNAVVELINKGMYPENNVLPPSYFANLTEEAFLNLP